VAELLPPILHISPVLPSHIIQRLGNLAQAAGSHGIHQLGKNITTGKRNVLQALQCGRGFFFMMFFKFGQTFQLRLFFWLSGSG
jgi:hypothetical protein